MRRAAALLAAAAAATGCSPKALESACPAQPAGEVALAGGEFMLGAAGLLPEEGPPRRVAVAPFAIDRTEVTNADFAAFVAATGYVTEAERRPDPARYPGADPKDLEPSALVFSPPRNGADMADPSAWWKVTPGASWRAPEGPGSTIAGRERHPVVQVSFADALAYARWKGRDLPTEAEWEFAARAGLDGARFEWGDDPPAAGRPPANTWQGVFPIRDEGADGHRARTAPVGCFPASAYGLFDMTGNVWEWTTGPTTTADVAQRVIKGGSYLCADNYCLRYRPAARQGGPDDTGSSHIGFRTVRRGLETSDPARTPS